MADKAVVKEVQPRTIADPKGRANHWLVDGKLVAGPVTAEDAEFLVDTPPSFTIRADVEAATLKADKLLEARNLRIEQLEELVDILIAKGIITLSDFSQPIKTMHEYVKAEKPA